MPNSPACFNTFHISELRKFIPNDKDLFPSRDHPSPGPVVTEDGLEEHVEDCKALDVWLKKKKEEQKIADKLAKSKKTACALFGVGESVSLVPDLQQPDDDPFMDSPTFTMDSQ
ncbi:hypothetical protein ARMSODRAFT_978194 [Armillaria solidipes]|uniref:Uncharacterized protein n=1 Tax=Armillaria solidipes TaxID=1076256 RepID=A0A2H3BPG4_9AGAR|nr:hypothetical protein ARMSODRAFT_978194 [Armillaria solidipes]